MTDLINVGAPVDVYAPTGHPDTLLVESGQTITTPGDLADEQPPDAYLTGEGETARLWPHSQWQLAEKPKSTPAAKATKSDATPAQSKES